jgi:hypothetical protein
LLVKWTFGVERLPDTVFPTAMSRALETGRPDVPSRDRHPEFLPATGEWGFFETRPDAGSRSQRKVMEKLFTVVTLRRVN